MTSSVEYVSSHFIAFGYLSSLPYLFYNALTVIRYYFTQTITCCCLLWTGTSVLAGPLFLAPEPMIHQMTQDKLFVQRFIKKQPALVKVGGKYPFMMAGGLVDLQVFHLNKSGVVMSPEIRHFALNGMVALDPYTTFLFKSKWQDAEAWSTVIRPSSSRHHSKLKVSKSDKKKDEKIEVSQLIQGMPIEHFALVVGNMSPTYGKTTLGSVTFPFKLYGVFGCFPSYLTPPKTPMVDQSNVLKISTHTMPRNPSKGVMIGAQKNLQKHQIGIEVGYFAPEHLGRRPATVMHLNGRYNTLDYCISGGLNVKVSDFYYNENEKNAHHLYLKGVIRGFSAYFTQCMASQLAFGAGSFELTMPTLRLKAFNIPLQSSLGYNWKNSIIPNNISDNALVALFRLPLSKYITCQVGARFKIHSEDIKDKDRVITVEKFPVVQTFVANLQLVF